jgi:hypothetical protein
MESRPFSPSACDLDRAAPGGSQGERERAAEGRAAARTCWLASSKSPISRSGLPFALPRTLHAPRPGSLTSASSLQSHLSDARGAGKYCTAPGSPKQEAGRLREINNNRLRLCHRLDSLPGA